MTFEGASQFKEALSRYSIEERKDLMFTKNTKVYVLMRCKKPKCPWYISGGKDSKIGIFHVIAYTDEHNCNRVNKVGRFTHRKLVDFLLQKIETLPMLKLFEIQQLVKKELKLEVTLL